ncbi:MAG TPA: DoxX family membrane protein [Candidatus Limnocylindrales bacterium]|nr:DoxX family membrane protein [Candidatus Limnocylindrales bacterium]
MGARRYVTPLAIVAAVVLFWMENPWFRPEQISDTVRAAATVAFWALFIVVLVLLFSDRNAPEAEVVEVEGPAFARYLFSNSRAGLFWLPIRIFVGFAWLEAGWHKLTDAGWTGGGEALRGYWERAVTIPEQGRPPITFEWYRSFIQLLLDNGAESWFAWLITFGELAVGIALLTGTLVGIAAFFGALMNMSFLLAGSASSNPVLFTMAIGLILAWRVAGYYGVDRWLLPILGTPWRAQVTTHPVHRGMPA